MVEAMPSQSFPPERHLFSNCVLRSIMHAIFITRAPFLDHEHSWNGSAYIVSNTQGTDGVIAFDSDRTEFICVVNSIESSRFERRTNVNTIFLESVPLALHSLLSKALMHLPKIRDEQSWPDLTGIFWSDIESDCVFSPELWTEALVNGAFLFEMYFSEPSQALEEWTDNYGFTEAEVSFTENLFRRWQVSHGSERLKDEELRLLKHLSTDAEGLQSSLRLLAQVGIAAP